MPSLWQRLVPNVRKYADAVGASGGTAEWIDLPKRGIRGNTHMLVMDANSDEIARLVADWLAKQGLVR
jgi:hypothetical protein